MGPEDGTMAAKRAENAAMGPKDGTMTAVRGNAGDNRGYTPEGG